MKKVQKSSSRYPKIYLERVSLSPLLYNHPLFPSLFVIAGDAFARARGTHIPIKTHRTNANVIKRKKERVCYAAHTHTERYTHT